MEDFKALLNFKVILKIQLYMNYNFEYHDVAASAALEDFTKEQLDKLVNKYDFIVSNPPYINKIDLKRLDNDIKLYEPLEALEAGIDGLSEVIKLIKQSNNLLKKNGKLVFEIGKNQVDKVTSLLKKNNFYINKVCKDIQSFPRVIISTKLF